MSKLNWQGEEVEVEEDVVVGDWIVNDGFSANYAYTGVSDEDRLDPNWRQYVSWQPNMAGALETGRRGCCSYKKVFSRQAFLDLVAQLPPDAEIEYRESEGFGDSWGFYTYRPLTEEELTLVRAQKEASQAKQETADRETYEKLLARHPEWKAE